MNVFKQVKLSSPIENLEIYVPPSFAGKRSKGGDIYIGMQPIFLTPDEIEFVENYIDQLPYDQSLIYTGYITVDSEDPLFSYTSAQLDELERDNGLPSTRDLPGGGQRSLYERVLLIRESGFVSGDSINVNTENLEPLRHILFTVDTVADLRQSFVTTSEQVFVNGQDTVEDQKWGIYRADVDDTTSVDNSDDVIVSSSGVRWKRVAPNYSIGYELNIASPITLGGVKINGSGLKIDPLGKLELNIAPAGGMSIDPNGAVQYVLPTASAATLGGIKIGTGLNIVDGKVTAQQYTLPVADSDVLGGIKIGRGIPVTDDGTISSFKHSNRIYVSSQGSDVNDGRSPETSLKTIKAAARLATTTPQVESIYVATGEFIEDNPIYLPPGTAVIGDNLRRTIVKPLNEGRDFFWWSSGCYVNYLVFQDYYYGGYGLLDTSAASANNYIPNAPDVPDGYKNAAALIDYQRETIINQAYLLMLQNSPGFSLDAINGATCKRDIGYFVDAISADIRFASNNNSIKAGKAYRSGANVIAAIDGEEAQTKLAFEKARDFCKLAITAVPEGYFGGTEISSVEKLDIEASINALTTLVNNIISGGTIPPSSNYGVAYNNLDPTISFNLPGVYKDAASLIDFQRQTIIDEVYTYISDGFTVPGGATGKCKRDIGYFIDAISADLRFGSNTNSIAAGAAYRNNGTLFGLNSNDELVQTKRAFNKARELCKLKIMTVPSGYPSFVDVTIPGECTQVKNAIDNLTDLVISLIDGNPAPISNYGVAYNNSSAPTTPSLPGAYKDAATLIDFHRTTIINTAYDQMIALQSGTFTISSADAVTCKRDIGYFVDAISADVRFGGNIHAIAAGRAYRNDTNTGLITTIVGEIAQTKQAFEKARDLCKQKIMEIPDSLAGTIATTNSSACTQVKDTIQSLTAIVVAIIDNGTIPTKNYGIAYNNLVASNVTKLPGVFKDAASLIDFQRNSIVDDAYAAMRSAHPTFSITDITDITKCKRDIGYFVDAISADLRLGSNVNAIAAGKAYRNGANLVFIDGELTETITAFNAARDLCKQRIMAVPDDYSSFIDVTIPGECTQVKDAIDNLSALVVSLINGGTTPAYNYGVTYNNLVLDGSISLPGVYKDAAGLIDFQREEIVIAAYDHMMSLNISFIVPGGPEKCQRDIGYFVDAISADLRVGSNINAITAGTAYRNGANVIAAIEGELVQTKQAFTKARDLCKEKIMTVPTGYPSLVDVTIPGACTQVKDAIDNLSALIISLIDGGTTPTYNYGVENNSVNNRQITITDLAFNVFPGHTLKRLPGVYKDAAELLRFHKDDIINTAYNQMIALPGNSGFTISADDAETCKRDIGYFVDAIRADIRTGGNVESIKAGKIYRDPFGDLIPTIAKEVRQTKQAFEKARDLCKLKIMDVPDSLDGTINEGNPGACTQVKDTIDNLTNLIINLIDGGDAPEYNPGPGYMLIDQEWVEVENVSGNRVTILSGKRASRNPITGKSTIASKHINGAVVSQGGRSFRYAVAFPDQCGYRGKGRISINGLVVTGVGTKFTKETFDGWFLKVETTLYPIQSVNSDTSITLADPVSRISNKAYKVVPKKEQIFLSPYIQNCSNISVLGSSYYDEESGNYDASLTRAGGMLVDNLQLDNKTPIPSNVVDAFTQIAFGGIGFHLKNEGYAQLVSVFQVFNSVGVLCESGAYVSVTNSATNFGDLGLVAVGYGNTAIPAYRTATITSVVNVAKPGFNATPTNILGTRFTQEGTKTKVTITVSGSDIGKFAVRQRVTIADHVSTPTINGEGLMLTGLDYSNSSIDLLLDTAWNNTYNNNMGLQTGAIVITEGKLETKVTVDGFKENPLSNYIVKIKNLPPHPSGFEYLVDNIEQPLSEGVCKFTLQQVIPAEDIVNIPNLQPVELRSPSTVNSSSHTFEYVGSGINYTALPINGGVTNRKKQTVEIASGKCYVSATDQDGNFEVGPYFNVNLRTGKVAFAGQLNLGVIDALELLGSPGTPIYQFTTQMALEASNALHTALPTEKAVYEFIFGKLGQLFGKQTTTGGGTGSGGKIVELDGSGLISSSMIPVVSASSYTAANATARKAIVGLKPGDIVYQDNPNPSEPAIKYLLLKTPPSNDDNWDIVAIETIDASAITSGIIDPARLGSINDQSNPNANTFLTGGGLWKPVVQTIEPAANSPIVIDTKGGTSAVLGGKAGFLQIDIRKAAYAFGQVDGTSTPGIAAFAFDDFSIVNSADASVVSIRNKLTNASSPLNFSSGILTISPANASTNGYLSNIDWTNFNNKQPALGFIPENVTNKSTSTALGNSDTLYPTQKAVKTYIADNRYVLPAATASVLGGVKVGDGLSVDGGGLTTVKLDPVIDNPLIVGSTGLAIAKATDTQSGYLDKVDRKTFNDFVNSKGQNSGLASLDAAGKIVTTQLPALAITDTFVVADQTAMLALTAQVGDVAVRSDLKKSFILAALPSTNLTSWQELLTPTDLVLSVSGRTGAVTLGKADVGLGNVDNTSDASKPVSTATRTALDLKQDADTAVTLAGTQTLTNKTLTSPAISNPTGITKSDIGLGNVVNKDTSNPVNITQTESYRFVTDTQISAWSSSQEALGYTPLKPSNNLSELTPTASTARTNIGLGNVNNTSDASKPVSTATQAALDLKLDKATLASTTTAGIVKVGTGLAVASGTVSLSAATTSVTGGVKVGSGLAVAADATISIEARTNLQSGTAYTLVPADNDLIIEFSNATAVAVTLPNSLPAGFSCLLMQSSTATVTISAASGATLRNARNHTKLFGQWSMATVYVRTNTAGNNAEWVLSGDTKL